MDEKATIDLLKKINEGAYICKHLLYSNDVGFNIPDETSIDLEAWCDKCEEILQEEGEWTEHATNFADFQPYCIYCFVELRNYFLS